MKSLISSSHANRAYIVFSLASIAASDPTCSGLRGSGSPSGTDIQSAITPAISNACAPGTANATVGSYYLAVNSPLQQGPSAHPGSQPAPPLANKPSDCATQFSNIIMACIVSANNYDGNSAVGDVTYTILNNLNPNPPNLPGLPPPPPSSPSAAPSNAPAPDGAAPSPPLPAAPSNAPSPGSPAPSPGGIAGGTGGGATGGGGSGGGNTPAGGSGSGSSGGSGGGGTTPAGGGSGGGSSGGSGGGGNTPAGGGSGGGSSGSSGGSSSGGGGGGSGGGGNSPSGGGGSGGSSGGSGGGGSGSGGNSPSGGGGSGGGSGGSSGSGGSGGGGTSPSGGGGTGSGSGGSSGSGSSGGGGGGGSGGNSPSSGGGSNGGGNGGSGGGDPEDVLGTGDDIQPCKRDMLISSITPTLVAHRLGKRVEQTVAGTDPLKSALQNIGTDALSSAKQLITNRLGPDALKNTMVTGLSGNYAIPPGKSITISGQKMTGNLPWTIRWDYDPVKLTHVNAEFGKGTDNPTFAYTFSNGQDASYGDGYMQQAVRLMNNLARLDVQASHDAGAPVFQQGTTLDDAVQSLVGHWSGLLTAPCPALGQPINNGGDPNSQP